MSSDSPRIAELRRRVHADPASIAFAQLAEEYRRAGNYEEAVKYCRNGLARHPGYLSARVTLGRALIELGALDEAEQELGLVLKSAADNLAAIRGMAEIYQRRGDLPKALEYYDRALALARFDPELEETVRRIEREIATVTVVPEDGEVFEQITAELMAALALVPTAPPKPQAPEADAVSEAPEASASARDTGEGELRRDPAEAASGREGGPAKLIDFDAILASLGVPDAAPPPLTEKLISDPEGAPAPFTFAPAPPPSGDPFADLERELRAFTPAVAPEPAAADTAVLSELEAWLGVLQAERASHTA